MDDPTEGDYILWHWGNYTPMLGRVVDTESVELIVNARGEFVPDSYGPVGLSGWVPSSEYRRICVVISPWHPLFEHVQAISLMHRMGLDIAAARPVIEEMKEACRWYHPHDWRQYRLKENIK